MAQPPVPDPGPPNEEACSHDLGSGVLLRELLAGDGPHPTGHRLVALAVRLRRPVAERPAAAGPS